ncbi:hypothetical protein T05_4226 [Trichinella murrelli]|uniref:Uncharacterized protein n=1 Tax=Trichinella murrelli TaxID=144512 RepID=A0A0V0TAG6_9BILA|nr:hypothetical protein T05_4226 [Trichinella murrelli]
MAVRRVVRSLTQGPAEGSQARGLGEDHPAVRELVNGRVWSASPVTIRTWKMATRRRDRASEDEPAKSDNGRTGADSEGANQTTPPSGSLHHLNLL